MDRYKGKRVMVTGHTGFKGSWLVQTLLHMDANVSGISLEPEERSHFNVLGLKDTVSSHYVDIRNFQDVRKVMQEEKPEILFHLAAQPLVRRGYDDPIYTYATNVLGTAHVLEAARQTDSIKAIVVITTDKVYENREEDRPFKETDRIGGRDPYSASKACAEIVSHSYAQSFFDIPVATARSGNVIGGGDWAEDRLFPDIIRAVFEGERLELRSPNAIRPWQHVLEPTFGYLILGELLLAGNEGGAWNFGPDGFHTVQDVVEQAYKAADIKPDYGVNKDTEKHESKILKLDNTKAKTLGWNPLLDFEETIQWTADWYKAYYNKEDMQEMTLRQIKDYERLHKRT